MLLPMSHSQSGYPTTSSPVLRECGDETLRTLRLPERVRDSLGRAGVRRGHRSHRFPRRIFAGLARAVVATQRDSTVARSGAPARVRGSDHFPHAGGAPFFSDSFLLPPFRGPPQTTRPRPACPPSSNPPVGRQFLV